MRPSLKRANVGHVLANFAGQIGADAIEQRRTVDQLPTFPNQRFGQVLLVAAAGDYGEGVLALTFDTLWIDTDLEIVVGLWRGLLPLPEQQEMVRDLIGPQLSGGVRVEPSAWREVLAKESVYGRYLDEVLPERSTP